MAGIQETQVNRVALATGSAGDGTGNAVPISSSNPLPMTMAAGGVAAAQRANNADAQAVSGTASNQAVVSFSYVFNGTSWDRQRGDTNGTDMVPAVRPTAGGVTQFRRLATADTNVVAVKASAGRVYGYVISNTSAAAKFVKLYNKATAPTIGTDVPVRTIMVPAGGIAAYHVGQGLAGFTAGIAIAATGAIGDADTTALAANDLIIQIDYA